MTEGDPREFYIRMLREYFPEFQMHFGFALETSSMWQISSTYFSFFFLTWALKYNNTMSDIFEGIQNVQI